MKDYWVQKKALAGNWVDTIGVDDLEKAQLYADAESQRDGPDTVRVMRRRDEQVWPLLCDRMPASKEDQLQRFGEAETHIKRAVHHISLSKVHKEKQDWRIFAQSAINILENAMKFKDEEEAV